MAVAVTQTKVSTQLNAFTTDAIETVTFDAAATSGSYVVVVIDISFTNRTIVSVTDNGSGGSNTYALLSQGGTDAHSEETTFTSAEVWMYGAQISNQMDTVTVEISSAYEDVAKVVILELDGQHATTPVEDVAVDNEGTTDTTHDVGPVTTAAAGNVVIGAAYGSTGSWNTAGGSWVNVMDTGQGIVDYLVVGAASTTWTVTTDGNEVAALVLVAIQPAAAGGGNDLSVGHLGEPVIGGSIF